MAVGNADRACSSIRSDNRLATRLPEPRVGSLPVKFATLRSQKAPGLRLHDRNETSDVQVAIKLCRFIRRQIPFPRLFGKRIHSLCILSVEVKREHIPVRRPASSDLEPE
jgi:hypothetical protein